MKYSRLISIHFQLTNRLFQGNESHGMDLVALNVQRGRDHGLPPYLEWRKICGLPKITSWKQLVSIVDGPQVFFKFNSILLKSFEFYLLFSWCPDYKDFTTELKTLTCLWEVLLSDPRPAQF